MYMSNTAVSYNNQKLLTLRRHTGSPPGFWLLIFFVSVLCLLFCLSCAASCVPNVASFSRLFILDFIFGVL